MTVLQFQIGLWLPARQISPHAGVMATFRYAEHGSEEWVSFIDASSWHTSSRHNPPHRPRPREGPRFARFECITIVLDQAGLLTRLRSVHICGARRGFQQQLPPSMRYWGSAWASNPARLRSRSFLPARKAPISVHSVGSSL